MLGFATMFHHNDDISLFMPLIDIPVRFRNLFQGIAPINDRFYRSCLNQLFDKDEIFNRIGTS